MTIVTTFITFLYQLTPLHMAAKGDLGSTVSFLMEKGADINIQDKTGVSIEGLISNA